MQNQKGKRLYCDFNFEDLQSGLSVVKQPKIEIRLAPRSPYALKFPHVYPSKYSIESGTRREETQMATLFPCFVQNFQQCPKDATRQTLGRTPESPEGLCVEAVFFSAFQPVFRSSQTWLRQIAAVNRPSNHAPLSPCRQCCSGMISARKRFAS